MSRYAKNTEVSVERSKAEIEQTLTRYGASQFMSGWNQEKAYVAFSIFKRMARFEIELPPKKDFIKTPGGKRDRSSEDVIKAWEQACRQTWRIMAFIIKAKLEAVETGVRTFEQEFLADVLLPNGATVGEYFKPVLEDAYKSKLMPPLQLPWKTETSKEM
jgi:hypothetical protein